MRIFILQLNNKIMIVQNIKNYFSKKEKGENVGGAPEGICPICWGRSEWDGKYYEVIKKNDNKIYESFISKIVKKHIDGVKKSKDKYICISCDKEI